jgi:hypothetical protein
MLVCRPSVDSLQARVEDPNPGTTTCGVHQNSNTTGTFCLSEAITAITTPPAHFACQKPAACIAGWDSYKDPSCTVTVVALSCHENAAMQMKGFTKSSEPAVSWPAALRVV